MIFIVRSEYLEFGKYYLKISYFQWYRNGISNVQENDMPQATMTKANITLFGFKMVASIVSWYARRHRWNIKCSWFAKRMV